jgi:hypothetical protein
MAVSLPRGLLVITGFMLSSINRHERNVNLLFIFWGLHPVAFFVKTLLRLTATIIKYILTVDTERSLLEQLKLSLYTHTRLKTNFKIYTSFNALAKGGD